ncbi:MAG: hypothetical protein L3J23_08615 [Flavobacteriaceae bacterium]|nr:hypothetical protein [Flavobacteriaceae bacterium]
MNIQTSPLARIGSFNPFNLDPLNDLNQKKLKTNPTKKLKLSFNTHSSLNLFVIVTGFSGKEHLNKSYTIKRPIHKNTAFFQNLFNEIEKKGNISLIKSLSNDGTFFWSKGEFSINSKDTIIFTAKNELISNKNEEPLNKLIHILDTLELTKNTSISKKYLEGYLEEKGIASFNDYITHL